jgi:hypothetical protein
MAYLDVNPLMASLRTRPDEFRFKGAWLTHVPSRHSFRFEPSGRVQIRAECNCALLAIHPYQEKQLADGFKDWHANYWQPLEINREFASHFRPRSGVRRWLIALTAKLNSWAMGSPSDPAHVAAE